MKKENPLVSVILPTYNRLRLLPRAINSVLSQGYSNLELIVCDDASSEDIRSLVESYGDPRLVYVRRERNGGAAAARNTGVSVAKGDFIAFQDSDDAWLQDKLDLQVAALSAASESTALVFCGFVRYCQTYLAHYPLPHLLPVGDDYFKTVRMNAIAFTQTWLVRRKALLETGCFDENLKIWDDWDLLLRLSKHNKIRCINRPLVLSHSTPNSVSSDLPARVTDLAHIIRKYKNETPRDGIFLGRLYYLLARFQCLNGQLVAGRRSLMTAMKFSPFAPKAVLLLLLTIMGQEGPRMFLKQGGPR